VDSAGAPTNDPHEVAALAPFGGAKGYALGLAIELLVATLTGTALGSAVTGTLDTQTVCTKGDLFLVWDPRVLGAARARAEVSEYLRELAGSPPAPGHPGVSIPGSGARRRRADRERDGIELPASLWRELVALDPVRATP
jgi:LDH2 family malate/lactate/ureidoglycolate dehydrogenase